MESGNDPQRQHELEQGIVCLDGYSLQSRKWSEEHLLNFLIDWWEVTRVRFPHIKTLLINLDNGPEKHSRRTQFMQRVLEFVEHYQITVRLGYYPPYHSKYK